MPSRADAPRWQDRTKQLDLNRLDIAQRIDCTFSVDDVFILEATNNLDHRIGFSDVREKLIPKTFTLGRPANKSCDVEKLNCSRHDLFCFD